MRRGTLKKLIKKLIPGSVKRYIKKNIQSDTCNEGNHKCTEYVVKTSDIDRLAGKRIMVTGGTGAIGSAICQRLLAEGATVGICGRDMEKVNALVARFQAQEQIKGIVIPLYLDVTDDSSIERAVEAFVQQTGGLDAFINNAGGGARGESKPIHEQSIEVIDRVLNTNLRGSMICARKAAQVMVEQKSGKIINMSSVVGMRGKAKMSDYAAAKAGILGFTQSLALELGMYNITVNCISPGMVNQTPFDAGMPVKETNTNCLKRFGYTDEAANVVAFILSNEADYITGHNFVVDGGRSLGLMGDA